MFKANFGCVGQRQDQNFGDCCEEKMDECRGQDQTVINCNCDGLICEQQQCQDQSGDSPTVIWAQNLPNGYNFETNGCCNNSCSCCVNPHGPSSRYVEMMPTGPACFCCEGQPLIHRSTFEWGNPTAPCSLSPHYGRLHAAFTRGGGVKQSMMLNETKDSIRLNPPHPFRHNIHFGYTFGWHTY